MLPKKEKQKKGLFSFFKHKKKDKDTNTNDNLRELGEVSVSETKELFSSKTLKRRSVNNKTIILIGSTGSGKSTLANVISGTNKFKESWKSTSETKEIQKEGFAEGGINYLAIDTVGIGDTQLKREEVLDKLAEAVYLAREGVSQVLFVIDGRFDEKEITNYNLLKSIIFDDKVVSHTTVIRTNFTDFENRIDREEDKKSLLDQSNDELGRIIKSCNGIIHVDNPSLNLVAPESEDDEKRRKREEKIKEREVTRSRSRKVLLKHLKQVCQKKPYQPSKLQELSDEIFYYMEEKINESKKLKEIKMTEDSEEDLKIISLEYVNEEETRVESIASTIVEKEWQQISNNQLLESNENKEKEVIAKLKLIITTLEYRIERLRNIKGLKEKTQKIDGFIRQKVLNHIFNNLDDIAQIMEGDIFLNSIIKNNDNSSESKLKLSELKDRKKELEKKLLEQGDNKQSLEKIEKKINQGEKILVELKKRLLSYKEIIEGWQRQDFTKEQAEEWISAGLELDEYEFANYLTKQSYQPTISQIKEIVAQESWRDIHLDFTIRKDWEKKEFSKEQTREWIQAGAKANDHGFVAWLRDTKNFTSEWIANYKEDYRILSERFKKYGLCSECNQPNTGNQWCQSCAEQKWSQLTGQALVNKFIEQQEESKGYKNLKWIPYEGFTNIKYLAEGGFGKVYKARWDNKEVALKSLNNSQNITADFLQEIASHKMFSANQGNNIINSLGISQDPWNKNYVMVMDYIKDGDLRKFLKENQLSFKSKLDQLLRIANGLKQIHHQGLIHKDFHSGNILNSSGSVGYFHSYITDLGLNKPADEVNEEKIYGVLPYIAPEILQGQPYTQASDVYSFGIIAYELFANSYPYLEMDNTGLALAVCQGLRPNLDAVPIPQSLKDLIKKCWEADPWKRPTAVELCNIINDWNGEIYNEENTPFYQQYKTTKDEYNTFSQNIPYKIHSNAVIHSRMINTKQITKLLENHQASKDLELDINEFNLDELNIQDESEQIQTQIEQPPK